MAAPRDGNPESLATESIAVKTSSSSRMVISAFNWFSIVTLKIQIEADSSFSKSTLSGLSRNKIFPILGINIAGKAMDSVRDELSALLQQGESDTVEFKETFDNEALESVAAFANTRGGTLLIGVRDDGTVVGIMLGKETLRDWANQTALATFS